MNNRQLEYFAETVKLKSFTKAANKLFVTQSALSKAIQSLESELGTVLIDRGAKDFQLTRDGETVFVYASEILDFFDKKTKQLLCELEKNKDEFSIGITPTSGAMYFSSMIYKYKRQYPSSSLIVKEVNTEEGIKMVLDGVIDMIVVIEPFEDQRIEKEPVVQSEAVLLVSNDHPFADRKSVSASEIIREPILMVGKEYKYYDFVMSKFREINCEPVFAFESNQWEFIFEMVANNQGISILPRPLIEKFNNSRVKQIHLSDPDFGWGMSVIRRKDRPVTSAMQNFWEMCRNNVVKNFIE